MGSPDKAGRLTLVVSIDLMERVKNAVFWTPGETMAGIGQRAIEAELRRIERANGGPFPPRTHPVKRGRPMA